MTDALAEPVLTLRTSQGSILATNDDWRTATNLAELSDVAGRISSFPLVSTAKDAALLVTLQPGAYTAVLGGAHDASGLALLEVYEVPGGVRSERLIWADRQR